MDGWTDPSVVRAQEMQERVGVVAEQAKKWQLPCKSAWVLAVWLCLNVHALSRVRRAAVEVAFLFTPFPIGKQHSRLQRRVFVGAVARRWTQPLSLSPLACGLGGMHEMAYPSQDSISPSTLDSLAACLLSSEKPFHHRMTTTLLLLGRGEEKKRNL